MRAAQPSSACVVKARGILASYPLGPLSSSGKWVTARTALDNAHGVPRRGPWAAGNQWTHAPSTPLVHANRTGRETALVSQSGCILGPQTHRLQAVPRAGGEVASHFNLPSLKHRRDEQGLPPQELAVHVPGAGVLREPSHRRDGAPESVRSRGQQRDSAARVPATRVSCPATCVLASLSTWFSVLVLLTLSFFSTRGSS